MTYKEIINQIPTYLKEKNKMTIISINPQIVLGASNYPQIVSLIEKSTHRIPDGIGIVLVSILTKGKIKKRVTGFDLMLKILKFADLNHSKIFLYGASKEVIKGAVLNIKKQFPNIIICGAIDGYTEWDEKYIISEINKYNVDFLFVGLGFPLQELWIANNLDDLNAKVYQDVGGSFDVLSGRIKRAPNIFIKFHLEWLYRSLENPKKLYRIFQLPIFLAKGLWWGWMSKDKNNEY